MYFYFIEKLGLCYLVGSVREVSLMLNLKVTTLNSWFRKNPKVKRKDFNIYRVKLTKIK